MLPNGLGLTTALTVHEPQVMSALGRQLIQSHSTTKPPPATFNCTHERRAIVTVAPVGRRGRFRAEVAGRIIVESSKQPLLDGARVLISEGYAPDIILEMWHANAAAFALRSTIGAAAKLTVEDDGAPRFRRWKPFLSRDGSPPISETDPAVTPPAAPDASAPPPPCCGKGASAP